MNRVIVTGGTGFIGSNLCKKLLDSGNEVIAVDNTVTSSKESIKELSKNKRFVFIEHDITRPFPNSLLKIASSVKTVYHLACPTGVENLTKLGEEMLLACSIGTRNILKLAKKAGASFLFASSSEVYGNPTTFPQSENYAGNVDITGIRSPYEEGKRFAESLVALFSRKYKMKTKIIRIFNTYGPRMSLNDTRIVPHFINQILRKKPLTVTGNGAQTRTFCYIDDLLDGIMLIEKEGKDGQVYNLGSNNSISMKNLALLFSILVKKKLKITFVPRPSHDHFGRFPLLSKIMNLGWKPKVSLTDGLKRTIQWYGL